MTMAGNDRIAEGQSQRRADRLRHQGRDEAEGDRPCLHLPKQLDVDLEPGREHQHQCPEVGEELRDRMVRPADIENVGPYEDPETEQNNEFWKSEAARNRGRADNDCNGNRKLCQLRQVHHDGPDVVEPLHRLCPPAWTVAPRAVPRMHQ